jgi:hypothetical protein
MTINNIPIMELKQTEVTLAELLSRFQGRTVGFQLPQLERVLLLLSREEYENLTAAMQAQQAIPTRAVSTLAQYYAETMRFLQVMENKHQMTSAEFYQRFQNGTLPEGPEDYWEWRTRYKSALIMQERFGFGENDSPDHG